MEVDQGWAEAAQTGNIDALYELFRRYPNLLDDVDKTTFIDTPLHIAASAGHTQFAIEVLGLKPSFSRKLNPDGLCPVVLALLGGHTATACRLVDCDPELIRVKGKWGFTPLHHVAESDDFSLLEAFLLRCPESLADTTNRRETAVHIAVRKGNMRALNVLLVWLKRTKMEDILNWTDEKGNTVLHVAVLTNNFEVAHLLIKKVNSDIKNMAGLTALHIARQRSSQGDGRITEISHPELMLSSLEESFMTRINKLTRWWNWTDRVSIDVANALLVVAVLIVTASYQALLTPPSRISSDSGSDHTNTTATTEQSGEVKRKKFMVFNFLCLNTTAFLSSLVLIQMVLNGMRLGRIGPYLKFSIYCLFLCYGFILGIVYSPALGSGFLLLTAFTAFGITLGGPIFCEIFVAIYKKGPSVLCN